MNNNRQSLGAYPCPIGIDIWCNAECAEAIDNCEAVTCRWLPVYHQAMADHRCARLLLSFEGDYADMASTAMLMSDSVNVDEWGDFREFVVSCAVALRAAGLKQTE